MFLTFYNFFWQFYVKTKGQIRIRIRTDPDPRSWRKKRFLSTDLYCPACENPWIVGQEKWCYTAPSENNLEDGRLANREELLLRNNNNNNNS